MFLSEEKHSVTIAEVVILLVHKDLSFYVTTFSQGERSKSFLLASEVILKDKH